MDSFHFITECVPRGRCPAALTVVTLHIPCPIPIDSRKEAWRSGARPKSKGVQSGCVGTGGRVCGLGVPLPTQRYRTLQPQTPQEYMLMGEYNLGEQSHIRG